MAIVTTLRGCVILAGLAFAASMPITSDTARSAPIEPTRHEVLEALAKAHAAVQRKQSKAPLDEIGRAEVALLNLGQLDQDPAPSRRSSSLPPQDRDPAEGSESRRHFAGGRGARPDRGDRCSAGGG